MHKIKTEYMQDSHIMVKIYSCLVALYSVDKTECISQNSTSVNAFQSQLKMILQTVVEIYIKHTGLQK